MSNMSTKWVCRHCQKGCKSERGLEQHTLRKKTCREAERTALLVRRPLSQDPQRAEGRLRRSTRAKKTAQSGTEDTQPSGAKIGGDLDPEAGVDDPETGVHDEENEDSVSGEDGYEGGLEDEDGGGYGTDSVGEGPKIGEIMPRSVGN